VPRVSKPKKADRPDASKLTVRALREDDWQVVEELFGPNGACGGCWRMWWRVPHGGKLWTEMKGKKNRAAFRKLIENGDVHAVLAFSDETPVGWCSFGPRGAYPRLERVKAFKRNWAADTWSILCFYIPAKWRGRGVASLLLEAATTHAFQLGAREVEGYPVVPPEPPAKIAATFAWTGVPALFAKVGYRETTGQTGHKRVVIKPAAPAARKSAGSRKKR
jgi:GNAT superfamily N-acetyltransferase